MSSEFLSSKFVAQSLTGGEVFLYDLDELLSLELLLVKDVTLLEQVDNLSHIKGDVLLHAKESIGLRLLSLLLLAEILEHNAQLFVVLREDALSDLEVFVGVSSLCFVLGSKGHKLVLKEVL